MYRNRYKLCMTYKFGITYIFVFHKDPAHASQFEETGHVPALSVLDQGLPDPEGPLLAASVRRTVNDPGEPFLGTGLVSPKFFDLTELEAQAFFYS